MNDLDLAYTPVWQLRKLMDSHQVSSVELTEMYLRRIEALNPRLNAYLTVTAEEALESARSADKLISQIGPSDSLLGVPISIKDLEVTKGIRTTLGSLVFKNAIPEVDSVVAERVRASGAVILGKTNTPEFGLQGITENKLGDACRNPWNTERTSGGSSGGAGSAVAAGMCAVATGTDGGGSIRNPSSFCGLYGIKPTLGRVPRAGGLGRPSPNLTSQSGPMARSVRDAAILLQTLSGHDARDPVSLRTTPPDFLDGLGERIQNLKIAWSLDLGYAAVDPEVAQITYEAVKVFDQLGCTVEEPNFHLENPTPAFMDIFYTNNCVSYGHLLPEHADELSDNGRFCLEHGANVTGVELAQALRFVEAMRGRLDDLMETYDLLITPTMAVPPFPVGQIPDRIGGQEVSQRGGYTPFTRAFNLSGQPAASIPCGFSAEDLPIGLHIIGRRGEEARVLHASAAFEEARPWAQRRPPIE